MKGKHKLAQNLKSTHSFARLSTLLVALICSGLMSCDRLGYKPATVVDDSILFDGIALASTMNHKKVYLRWEASSDPRVTMYQVYGGTSIENIIGTTTASKTEMIVPNLANGFTGVYMVQACTSPDVCSATTRALSASTLNHTVPDFNGLSSATVPTGAFGLSTVELNWDNAQGDVTGYQVFQGLGSMQTSLVDYSSPLQTDDTQSSLAWGHYIPASGATNSTTIKGLTPGTEYSFVVRAFYANGSQVLREVNSIARSATTAAIGSVPAGNPTIANLDPSFDLPSGGKQIAILGSNFMPDAVISIGSSACINQVYNGPSEILCTIPAGSAGSETVSYLSTVNGGTTYGGYFYYTSLPAPEVANISPNVSALNGGTTIQIAGSHFTTGANILIGGMPCVGTPTYVSPQLYTCITPPLPAGSHDVRVVNSDTQEVTRLAGVRYMGTPTVTDVSPKLANASSSALVEIEGTNFPDLPVVLIDGQACTSVVILSQGTRLRCSTPHYSTPLSTGQLVDVDISVTNSGTSQSGSLTGVFQYTGSSQPLIGSLEPAAGSTNGGTTVLVNGGNFEVGSKILLGGVECQNFQYIGPSQISCVTSPTSAAVVDVAVRNPDGQEATEPNGYTYTTQPQPTVTAVTPGAGPTGGGETITIQGQDLQPGLQVFLGTVQCTGAITDPSGSFATCITQGDVSGYKNIKVVNPDTQFATLTPGYKYTNDPAPSVSSVTPNEAQENTTVPVTISGANFQANPKVYFGTIECRNAVANTTTSISCDLDPGPSGQYHVKVVNSDTQEGTGNDLFSFIGPVRVTSVIPASGHFWGKNQITVKGEGFSAGSQVFVNGEVCDNPNRIDYANITCKPRGGPSGPVDVEVRRVTDNSADTLAAGYTYRPGPSIYRVTPYSSLSSGSVITVHGQNFDSNATILVDGQVCGAVSGSSATELQCVLPTLASDGYKDLEVVNTDTQKEILYDALHYGNLIYDFKQVSMVSGVQKPQRVVDSTIKDEVRFRAPLDLEHAVIAGEDYIFSSSPLHTIRKTHVATGETETIAGKTGAATNSNDFVNTANTPAFDNPIGIAYDALRNYLYVASSHAHCIRKVDLNFSPSTIETISGVCGSSSSIATSGSAADHKYGTQARYYFPRFLKLDGNRLYISTSRTLHELNVDDSIDPSLRYYVKHIAGRGSNSGAYTDDNGKLALMISPYGLEKKGDFLYYAQETHNGLMQVDLSDPAYPVSQLAATSTHANVVAATGDRLYYTTGRGRVLRYFSFLDGSNQVLLGDLSGYQTRTQAVTINGEPVAFHEETGSLSSFDPGNANRTVIAGLQNAPVNANGGDNVGTSSAAFSGARSMVRHGDYIYIADTNNHKIKRMHRQTRVAEEYLGSGSCEHTDSIGGGICEPNHVQRVGDYLVFLSGTAIKSVYVPNKEVSTIAGISDQSGTADGPPGVGAFRFAYHGSLAVNGEKGYVYDTNQFRGFDLSTGNLSTLVTNSASTFVQVFGSFSDSRTYSPVDGYASTQFAFLSADRLVGIASHYGNTINEFDVVGEQTRLLKGCHPANCDGLWTRGNDLFILRRDALGIQRWAIQPPGTQVSINTMTTVVAKSLANNGTEGPLSDGISNWPDFAENMLWDGSRIYMVDRSGSAIWMIE